MTKAVHQLLAAAGQGDAITGFAFEIQAILRAAGFESEMFAPLDFVPALFRNTRIKPLDSVEHALTCDSILIYHYSTGSASTPVYVASACRKWICYHNITPEKFFRAFSDDMVNRLTEGRRALKDLVAATELALGVSEYNRSELVQMGFRNTAVLPLVLSMDYLKAEPSPATLARYMDGRTNILFVGRVAPNKRFEDLIRTFYYYHRVINTNSRLILAGSPHGYESYSTYVKAMVVDAGLVDAVEFTGQVQLPDLIACYRSATAFLCLSQHEGFCLPLLEAMQFDVPVFALGEAAIPETLGGAGVLIHEGHFMKIAELVNEVLVRPDLVNDILTGQRQRLKQFDHSGFSEQLLRLIRASAR